MMQKTTTKAPTKRFRRKKTPAVITTSPQPDALSETPHPPRPPRPPRDTSVPDTIFCTVSYRALYEYQYPPDGLCTHLVYSELVIHDGVIKSRLEPLGVGLSSFMSHANKAQKTRHGASFSYDYADDTASAMRGSSSPITSTLWSSNVRDYGILLAYDKTSHLQDASNKRLALLKALRSEQQKQTPTDPTPDLFVGVLSRDHGATRKMTILRDVANHYQITILIFITHFFMDDEKGPQPPTALSGTGKPVKLSGISADLSSAGIKKDVTLLTSFTLAVNKYRMQNGWSGGNTGDVVSFAPIRYYDACYLKNHMVKVSRDYAYIAIKDRHVLLTYDTSENLIYKMSEVFTTYAHPKHGVAIYDVDYDQYNDTCGTPDFYRLRQLSRYMLM
ncbi:uncharacterized protein [Dermacentor albipictus]|uniref:uncharacterized protein n=1 Tax=Dermacentor albipictus TaxID=60249 RepID=UPI0031FD8BC2